MEPRGTDAIPLPPRPSLEQYQKRAKGLLKACRSGDTEAVRSWARDWVEALVTLQEAHESSSATTNRAGWLHRTHIDREVRHIERDARASGFSAVGTSRGGRDHVA